MKTLMLGLLAETPVHPGTGRSMGVVDLPVAREAATDYPVIVGSSIKGALRDKMKANHADKTEQCFGKPDNAGDLIVSDGRLLLLPVRSLSGAYRWVTCPLILERYKRDLARTGLTAGFTVNRLDATQQALSEGNGALFLEERQFQISGGLPDGLVDDVKPLILHDETKSRLASQITVLHDDDFAWFARYGLSIQARNVLDDKSKKSQNLWYEETLPPDCLMYALIAARKHEALKDLAGLFPETDPYIQMGGNETVGHGWFVVSVRKKETGGGA